ncbi:hypothetical protein [Paenibacillus daejeonensis]|uniref:hypothetical protein n=1 Tax=Paenibacillus daejeonensis TaxID=135193 RepID=UPI00035CF48B|nr:hypothetical protein [Paenibacillus daejeonensis]
MTHDQVSGWASLIDKYGIVPIFAIVSFGLLMFIMRKILKGELVPREFLTKVEQQRDDAVKQLGATTQAVEQVTIAVNNLKRDEARRG